MKIRYTACIIIGAMFSILKAQDPQFSQYYAAPLYLNPGFTGATQAHRLVANHRLQWPNLPQVFATYAFSYDYYKSDLRSGFGFLATTDLAGSAALRSTSLGFLYSYKLRSENNWIFSPGLYFGYTVRNVDFNKLLFGDQIEFDQSGAPTLDPAFGNLGNNKYFDFGAGMLVYNKIIWGGISFYHINRPSNSLLDADSQLPMKIAIHGGIRIPVFSDSRRLEEVSSITPSFIYKRQGDFQQLDAGVNYHIAPVMVGFWFRGIPVIKNVVGNTSRDAIVFIIGLQFSQFEMGYSYDFTISELGVDTGGTHEISLIYQFETFSNKKIVKRKEKFIPCPSFNTKKFWKN